MARSNKAKPKKKRSKKVKPAPKTFGINLRDMFFGSLEAYFKAVLPITLAGLVSCGAVAGGWYAAEAVLDGDGGYRQTIVLILAMTVVGTVSLPWYFYALAVAEGRKIAWGEPFKKPQLFYAQAVCSFWFSAAFLLGLRYLLGVPAILVVVFYAFHGYLLADGAVNRGLEALGMSVRLGQGRRIGLFAIAALLGIFTLFGASTMGMEEWSQLLKVAGAIAGSAVTGSITMIAGAKIYLTLERDLK